MSEVKPLKCPQCEREIHGVPPERCPACRCLLTFGENDSLGPGALIPQRLTWSFWVVFLATPVMAVAAMSFRPNLFSWLQKAGIVLPAQAMVVGTVIGGVLASGYLLARTHARSRMGLAIGTVLWTLGVLVLYAGLAFVGCVAVISISK